MIQTTTEEPKDKKQHEEELQGDKGVKGTTSSMDMEEHGEALQYIFTATAIIL